MPLEANELLPPKPLGDDVKSGDSLIPSRIGKYEVRSEIGHGGFGRVYMAFDASMSRQVAIKVLASEPDPEILTQFHAEAKTTGKLRHKNIVTVYEFGEHEGFPFLAMELLEGNTLDDFIRGKGDLALLGKLRVISEVAEGLRYAHEQGVIHRDVKPANIMLLPNGGVKIMDFGIARLVDLGTTRRTKNRNLTGTALYMAPEQFRGSAADVQTDIFSFGMMCYEFLSGGHPFPEESDSGIVYRVATRQAEPLNQRVSGFPETLSRVVERAMSRDREVRYQTVEDFALDIEPILADLRFRKAAEIMVEVDRAVASGDHEAARSLIKRVLELDPSNTPARQLRNKFQSDDLARVMQQRNDALLQEGTARMAALQYGEAIESFETILRVDPNCNEAKVGFEKAHTLLKISRMRGRLLSQGKQEAFAGNWRAALDHATEALKVDPDNQQAQAFEQDVLLRLALNESGDLLQREEFESAESILNRLSPALAAHPAARAERERIRAAKEYSIQERKRQEIEARLAEIEYHRIEGDFDHALALTQNARTDFGDGLFDFSEKVFQIREEQAFAKRAKIVQKALADSQNLLTEEKHVEALEVLDAALQAYPREKSLVKLRETASQQLAEYSRAKAAAQAGAETIALRETGDLAGALTLIERALLAFPGNSELSGLAAGVQLQISEQAAAADWVSIQAKTVELLESDAVAALAVLKAASERHGRRGDYAELFEEVRIKSDLAERIGTVQDAIERKDWRSAGAKLESAAQIGLSQAAYDELASIIKSGRRAEKMTVLLTRARGELDSGNTVVAEELLARVEKCPELEDERESIAFRIRAKKGLPGSHSEIGVSCIKCGTPVPLNARFCDNCGAAITVEAGI